MQKRIYLSCPTMHGEEQKYVQEAFDTRGANGRLIVVETERE